MTPDDYDHFDVGQWEFRVLSRRTLEEVGGRSIGLSTLAASGAEPITLATLADAVARADAQNEPPQAV